MPYLSCCASGKPPDLPHRHAGATSRMYSPVAIFLITRSRWVRWTGESRRVLLPLVIVAAAVSLMTLPGQDGRDGASEDAEVHEQRPLIDVAKIELGSLVEMVVERGMDLPQAGHARAHREPPSMPDVVSVDLAGRSRARPNEVASEMIPIKGGEGTSPNR